MLPSTTYHARLYHGAFLWLVSSITTVTKLASELATMLDLGALGAFRFMWYRGLLELDMFMKPAHGVLADG